MEFQANYPFVAPYLRFRTPIFHPNITPTGMMSSLMVDAWNPRDTVETIYTQVCQMLAAPLKEYPYNDTAAHLYARDHAAFCKRVQDTYMSHLTISSPHIHPSQDP
jgi:ubiquitin-protein ligase